MPGAIWVPTRYVTKQQRALKDMKLSDTEPWMPAPAYGHSLRGLTINLLVRDIAAAPPFHHAVLGAEVVYSDPDFAVLRHADAEWMLHADHTYDEHPFRQLVNQVEMRGAGVELRLHGRDPDQAEAATRRLGCTVLASASDRPHGLREAFVVDVDGYVWVPDVPSSS